LNNWLELNIPVDNALKLDPKSFLDSPYNLYNQLYIPQHGGVWQVPAIEMFNESWLIDVESKLDIKVDAGLIFYREGGYQHPGAHIDVEPLNGETLPVAASFNWVLDKDEQSQMTWYEPWWDAEDIDQIKAAALGKYVHPQVESPAEEEHNAILYQETPVELLKEYDCHSLSHKHLTMVRTNVPHNVRMGANTRWCITLRTWGGLPCRWSDCVKQFKRMQDSR